MGCCCSRPVDDDEEVKVVKAEPSNGRGGYGTIATGDEENTDIKETDLKEPVDVILKNETATPNPVKEHDKHVKSHATPKASPLLETAPSGFERLSPKRTPQLTPAGTPKTSPPPSPKSTPKSTPKSSPKPSPKRSPKKNVSPAKETLKTKSSRSPSEGRPSSKDYSKLEETPDHTPVDGDSGEAPSSPSKPKLLDLAKLAVHTGRLDSGQHDSEEKGNNEDETQQQAAQQIETEDSDSDSDSSSSSSSDDNAQTSHAQTSFAQTSFDQTPICHSGDEMSPKVVKTQYQPEPKQEDAKQAGSTLDRKKAKETVKKTGKTMKEAGKKLGKMFKFGSPAKKKADKKADPKKGKSKGEIQKSSEAPVASSPKTKYTQGAATKKDINQGGTSSSGIANKSRMSERMRSTYARERMEAYETKREKTAARRTQSAGLTDPRKAAHERGQKLSELDEVTENMRDNAAGFAEMARQLRLKSEGKS